MAAGKSGSVDWDVATMSITCSWPRVRRRTFIMRFGHTTEPWLGGVNSSHAGCWIGESIAAPRSCAAAAAVAALQCPTARHARQR